MDKILLGDLCLPASKNIKLASTDLIDYVDISSVDNQAKFITGYTTYEYQDAPSRARKSVSIGDVIISTVRPNLNAVAVFDITTPNTPVVSTGFCVLSCRDDVNPRYVYYACQSREFIRQLVSQATGASYPAVNDKIIRNALIPNYTLSSQNSICDQLDSVQNLINIKKKENKIFNETIKARFVETFGDPRLNPNGYPVHQLSEYIEFLTSGSRGWAQYCVDDGSEWFITIKNVKDCRISLDNIQPINAPDNAEAKRTRVQEGDLLISITADLGRTGVVSKEIAEHGAYINQHLTCIRLNREVLEPLYVAYFMESPAGKEQFTSKNQSAVKAGLNFNSINTLQLLIPPKSVQQEFLAFVAQVDKSKSVNDRIIDRLQKTKASLMQEYFG